MSPLDKDLRRGWRRFLTKEFLSSLACMALAYRFLPVYERTVAISAIADLYYISRMLFKRNRGMFYSSWICTETWIWLPAQALALLSWHLIWFLPLINQAVFLLCRGRIKGIGTTTHFIR